MISLPKQTHLRWAALSLLAISAVLVFTGYQQQPQLPQQHSEHDTQQGAESSPTFFDENHRSLRLYDPKTMLPKIPRIVHFTIADDPPAHQMKVIEYSRELQEAQGFQVMIHRDKDADKLIRKEYPKLIKSWEALLQNDLPDRGARIGDFVRLLLLHHYGGVYLDGDMVACRNLRELTDAPGVATFPLVNSNAGQILNSVMAGPPKHPVFWIALDIMKTNKELASEHILYATGPGLIGQAVDAYFEVTHTPYIVPMSAKQSLPKPEPEGNKWLQSGLVRFGAVERAAGEQTRGMGTSAVLGLCHLHWRTWVTKGRVGTKYSACDSDLDLIKPYLDYSCKMVEKYDNKRWSHCGDISTHHSGLWKDEHTRPKKND